MMNSSAMPFTVLAFCIISMSMTALAQSGSETEEGLSKIDDGTVGGARETVEASPGPHHTWNRPELYRSPASQVPSQHTQWTSREVIFSILIVLLGAPIFAAPAYISASLRLDWDSGSGLCLSLGTVILACAAVFMFATFTTQQLAATSGVVGTAAGYVLAGATRARAVGQSE